MNLHYPNIPFEARRQIAARLRKSRKVNSTLVDIEWHAAGSTVGLWPGTQYKATIKLKEGTLIFLIYLPTPKNSRQIALAVLCQHLEGLTLSIPKAQIQST